jgi:hypothetical protein
MARYKGLMGADSSKVVAQVKQKVCNAEENVKIKPPIVENRPIFGGFRGDAV